MGTDTIRICTAPSTSSRTLTESMQIANTLQIMGTPFSNIAIHLQLYNIWAIYLVPIVM